MYVCMYDVYVNHFRLEATLRDGAKELKSCRGKIDIHIMHTYIHTYSGTWIVNESMLTGESLIEHTRSCTHTHKCTFPYVYMHTSYIHTYIYMHTLIEVAHHTYIHTSYIHTSYIYMHKLIEVAQMFLTMLCATDQDLICIFFRLNSNNFFLCRQGRGCGCAQTYYTGSELRYRNA
jgi:hypothetical protein